MANSKLYKQLVQQALNLPDSRWSIGGNAPLMGRRFFLEGWKVLLAAKMSKKLKSYIPDAMRIVGGEENEEISDDVHMILEYKANEHFGAYKAPRANRFIIHNDANNPLLSSLEKFDEVVSAFEPDLFIISGLQMMDNYPVKLDGSTGEYHFYYLQIVILISY